MQYVIRMAQASTCSSRCQAILANQDPLDKAMTVKRDRLGEAFACASDAVMLEIGRCLALFLGIAR